MTDSVLMTVSMRLHRKLKSRTNRKHLKKMNSSKPKLTLYQPAAYQIKVPGVLNARWVDEASSLRVEVEEGADGQPVTALTGLMDQAALLGLLRRLNGMGLPLILVMCVDFVENRITSEG